MNILYNAPEMKERRRTLRKKMTLAEKMLWERLRGRRFQGLRFLRQYSVQQFVLDFYCPQLRLAIELDGAGHLGEGEEYDQERDAILHAHDIIVLRAWNNDALENIDIVLEKIAAKITYLRNASLERKGGREGS
jgi:very-short-patch-repair endonuclease